MSSYVKHKLTPSSEPDFLHAPHHLLNEVPPKLLPWHCHSLPTFLRSFRGLVLRHTSGMITDSGTPPKKLTFYNKGDDSTHCVHYVLGLIIRLKLVVKSLNKKNIKGIFNFQLQICVIPSLFQQFTPPNMDSNGIQPKSRVKFHKLEYYKYTKLKCDPVIERFIRLAGDSWYMNGSSK